MAYQNPSATYRPKVTSAPAIDPTGQQILAPTWGGQRTSTGGVGSYNPTQAVKKATSMGNRVTNEGGVSYKGPSMTETGISTGDALANQNAQTAPQNRVYSGGVAGVKSAPQKTDQQKEWDLLKQQAAASMATAKSEADIRTAALMQTAREGMYQSGAQAGSAAYRSAEQRAMDVGSLDRMGAVNEVAGQNLENTMQQQAKDTARNQEVSDREDTYQKQQKETQYNTARDTLLSIYNNASLAPEARQKAGDDLRALESQYFGGTGFTPTDYSALATAQGGAKSDAELVAEKNASNVGYTLGITDPVEQERIGKAADVNGVGSSELTQYSSFLMDQRSASFPSMAQAAQTAPETVSKDDWNYILSSPQWQRDPGKFVDFASQPEPGKPIAVGGTFMLDGKPYIVTSNPKGEGLYAKDLSNPEGGSFLVQNWQKTAAKDVGNLPLDAQGNLRMW